MCYRVLGKDTNRKYFALFGNIIVKIFSLKNILYATEILFLSFLLLHSYFGHIQTIFVSDFQLIGIRTVRDKPQNLSNSLRRRTILSLS